MRDHRKCGSDQGSGLLETSLILAMVTMGVAAPIAVMSGAWALAGALTFAAIAISPIVAWSIRQELADEIEVAEQLRYPHGGKQAAEVWHVGGGNVVIPIPLSGPIPRVERARRGVPAKPQGVRLAGPEEHPGQFPVRQVTLNGEFTDGRDADHRAA